ncbi:hypothetical protein DFS34DRAFT_694072 [Phlyctochytrium arcticum]|nr:hypothetical protein DFS34DRAFT_694072 [Phlyctochytrium arcticum]
MQNITDLQSLPLDLLHLITLYLPPPDLFRLQRVSKCLNTYILSYAQQGLCGRIKRQLQGMRGISTQDQLQSAKWVMGTLAATSLGKLEPSFTTALFRGRKPHTDLSFLPLTRAVWAGYEDGAEKVVFEAKLPPSSNHQRSIYFTRSIVRLPQEDPGTDAAAGAVYSVSFSLSYVDPGLVHLLGFTFLLAGASNDAPMMHFAAYRADFDWTLMRALAGLYVDPTHQDALDAFWSELLYVCLGPVPAFAGTLYIPQLVRGDSEGPPRSPLETSVEGSSSSSPCPAVSHMLADYLPYLTSQPRRLALLSFVKEASLTRLGSRQVMSHKIHTLNRMMVANSDPVAMEEACKSSTAFLQTVTSMEWISGTWSQVPGGDLWIAKYGSCRDLLEGRCRVQTDGGYSNLQLRIELIARGTFETTLVWSSSDGKSGDEATRDSLINELFRGRKVSKRVVLQSLMACCVRWDVPLPWTAQMIHGAVTSIEQV